jgi:hypothetical protein
MGTPWRKRKAVEQLSGGSVPKSDCLIVLSEDLPAVRRKANTLDIISISESSQEFAGGYVP